MTTDPGLRPSEASRTYAVAPATSLSGRVSPPADKSVSHRSAMFAAIADGESRIKGYPRGADTLSTLHCLGQLGVPIRWEGDTVVVSGVGRNGLQAPDSPLDCGNSGTTLRLLSGLLAGQPFETVLTGDASLSSRPMERIATPLRLMGATVDLTDGKAPVRIQGNRDLRGFAYDLPIPSAQVKSAVLLAGLYASGETAVIETLPTRDHTERMLGLPTEILNGRRVIRSSRSITPIAIDIDLPRDISSAAYFIAAASIMNRSLVVLEGVGINPTRTGLIDVLNACGAELELRHRRLVGHEPVADILVRSASLTPIRVDAEIAPRLIDEIPILAVVATRCQGLSRFTGVEELRAKESDRIEAMKTGLGRLGATINDTKSDFELRGPVKLTGNSVDGFHDHRIVMSMAIAGLIADGPTHISGAEAADISYPTFWEDLERLSRP